MQELRKINEDKKANEMTSTEEWNHYYLLLKKYVNEHGEIPKINDKTEIGRKLIQWIIKQKLILTANKDIITLEGRILELKKRQLEKLGVTFQNPSQHLKIWNIYFNRVLQILKERGTIPTLRRFCHEYSREEL